MASIRPVGAASAVTQSAAMPSPAGDRRGVVSLLFLLFAITYLDRHELAQVEPEDLRGDALHRSAEEEEFESEQVMEERLVEPKVPSKAFATPRSDHLKPLKTNGNGNGGHKSGANGPATSTEEKVRIARAKGYEGDPCSECGQLTLVRSGACCKCDTCGATSGCS